MKSVFDPFDIDLAGAAYSGQATTFAWANQICADDDQERGIVLASMKYVVLFYKRTCILTCVSQHVEQRHQCVVATDILSSD